MRRISLFNQVLLFVALVGATGAVVSALAAGAEASIPLIAAIAVLTGASGAVLALAGLSSRFSSLETLVDEMEKVDLSKPGANLPASIDGRAEAEEVERLEISFLRMMRRLEAERRRASSAALTAQERERARVARDLHDEVNQSLTGLLLRLEAVREDAPEGLRDQIDEIKTVASQAMDELLVLARALRPTALDDLGLRAALEGLVEKAGEGTAASASLKIGEAEGWTGSELAGEVQLVVYRVAQEALANAVRHSGAGSIEVGLESGDDGILLSVKDDGSGFAFSESEQGLGLEGMRERALLVGGRLDVESRPGIGTTVTLRIPPIPLADPVRPTTTA